MDKDEHEKQKFRKVFVVDPVHDITIIKQYTDSVVFLSNGNEPYTELAPRIAESLKEFDPDQDAIIPMGRSTAGVIAGIVIGQQFSTVVIGMFRGKTYEFMKVRI